MAINPWKGYQVKFDEFTRYYRSTSRTDNSAYLRSFVTAFRNEMDKAGYPEGLYSNTVNRVEKGMTALCRNTRVQMVSNGVPAAAATQIINSFKRWFKGRWA